MKAIWNGATIAQSDATVVVEGNHYFPADSITRERDPGSYFCTPWIRTCPAPEHRCYFPSVCSSTNRR